MKGKDLPKGDRIVRYVKPSMIQEDGTADGSDFCLRPENPNETGLSVNWLEAFEPGLAHQLAEVRRLSRLKLKPKGCFAEISVDAVRCKVAEEWDTLRIIHDPLEAEEQFEADPSHSEVIGLPPGGSDQAMLVGDLIAECVIDMHPVISLGG